MTDITPHGSQPAKLGHSPVADVPHVLRAADTNPKAAKRAERQIASMFLLSMILVVAFIVSFVMIDKDTVVYIPVFGEVGLMTIMLGLTSGLSIFLIGAGAIQWAKKLMPDVEVVQIFGPSILRKNSYDPTERPRTSKLPSVGRINSIP